MLGKLNGAQASLAQLVLGLQTVHQVEQIVLEGLRLAQILALVGFTRVAQATHVGCFVCERASGIVLALRVAGRVRVEEYLDDSGSTLIRAHAIQARTTTTAQTTIGRGVAVRGAILREVELERGGLVLAPLRAEYFALDKVCAPRGARATRCAQARRARGMRSRR